jgi:predicted ATP-grasp superfamily ATP-dependent carboligase
VRAGFQPIAADLFADDDLRRIATATRVSPYPEGLVDWMRAIEPPAWMYTGALENHPELVDQMAWIAPLLGNPGDVLKRVRSPWELAKVLGSAGLLFPEIRESADGLPHDGSWLAKTYRGASGSGVRGCERGARGEERDELASSDAVYQRRIQGVPCAALYVAAGGAATLIGVTRQLVGEPWLNSHGFQYAGSVGPHPIGDKARDALMRIGIVLAVEFDLVGLFGVDFVLDGDDVWTLEVNPRYTASVEVVERFTGVSAIELHAQACGVGYRQRAGASPPPSPSFIPETRAARAIGAEDASPRRSAHGGLSRAHGKAILFARREVTLTERFAETALAEAVREPWPTLADVSPAGTVVDEGRPVLTMFAEGSDVSEVEAKLRERCVEISSLLYD